MTWLLLMLSCRALTVNDVTSGESEDYPELRSLHQPVPAPVMTTHALRVAEARPGWSGCARVGVGLVRCAAEGPLSWPAQVEIDVEPAGLKASRLQLQVTTESPAGDLGFGAREIEGFQAAFLSTPIGRE